MPFHCKVCGYTAPTRAALLAHQTNSAALQRHDDIRAASRAVEIACHCGEPFSNRTDLRKHMRWCPVALINTTSPKAVARAARQLGISVETLRRQAGIKIRRGAYTL